MDGPNYNISLYADPATGFTVTGPVMTLQNKLTYGYLNSNGKHQSTAETLSSYGTGTNVMTPSSFAESATNNIGSINSGGMLVKGDVGCQDGTNIASWTVSGLFLVSGSTLTHGGTDAIAQTGNSGAAAPKWTVQFGVDAANNAPTLSSTITSSTSATCTARVDAIIMQ